MIQLSQAIPDADMLLELATEELAAKMLFLIRQRPGSDIFHPDSMTGELWVRRADDLLVTGVYTRGVYLRRTSATRCKGAAKSIRFRHEMHKRRRLSRELARVELGNINQPDDRRLKPARLP